MAPGGDCHFFCYAFVAFGSGIIIVVVVIIITKQYNSSIKQSTYATVSVILFLMRVFFQLNKTLVDTLINIEVFDLRGELHSILVFKSCDFLTFSPDKNTVFFPRLLFVALLFSSRASSF